MAVAVHVGNALLEIRDSRLYRTSHGTFEDYCQDRWQFTHGRARQLIAAAETIAILQSDTIVSLLPEGERQARPLTALPPEAQREVWAATPQNGLGCLYFLADDKMYVCGVYR